MATIYGKTSGGATAIYNTPGSLYWQCYVTYTSNSAELWLYVGAASSSGHLYVNIDSYIGSTDFANYTNTYMASGESHKLGTVSINPGEAYSFSATCKSGSWGQNGTLSGTIPVQAQAPSYNSISSSNISSSGVTLTASINNKGATITSGGWQLSTNGGSTWTTYSGDWGSKTITGLSRNTTYTYRGYATNSVGTTYSSTSAFTTLKEVPVISNPAVSNITSNSAYISYTVTDAGGGTVSSNVIKVYDVNADVLVATINSNAGTATGLSPNTLYAADGQATNEVGTSMIKSATFTTLAAQGLPVSVNGGAFSNKTIYLSVNGGSFNNIGAKIKTSVNGGSF